jgi:ABC-type sugar transport system ATPase subunit
VARFFRNGNFIAGVRNGSTVSTSQGDITVDSATVPAGDGPVVLTIRPEEIELSSDRSGQNNLVPAMVTSVIYMGSHTQLVVEVGDSTWHVQGPAGLQASEGERIHLRLPQEHLWIVEEDSVPVATEQDVAV